MIACAGNIKIWNHSTSQNNSAHSGKLKHRLNMRSVMGAGSGLGGVINNPKRQRTLRSDHAIAAVISVMAFNISGEKNKDGLRMAM